jgi:hypothetical protein
VNSSFHKPRASSIGARTEFSLPIRDGDGDEAGLELEDEDEWKTAVRELMLQANRSKRHRTQATSGEVNTMYKSVKNKVRPVDDPRGDVEMEFGLSDWRERAVARQQARLALRQPDLDPFAGLFEPRYAEFPRGTRLNPNRLAAMNIGTELWPAEVHLIHELMFHREAALAWEFSEMTGINHEVAPPYKIRTIEHQAWQERGFNCPKSLEPTVIKMIQERVDRSTLELCDSQYRNPWFLVKKKDKGYRLINNAQKLNGKTIRDAALPPSADEFSERIAGRAIYSLFDLFSGYDQITLHTSSRDMTAFQTPIGLVRQCTIPMGATNSVATFLRTVMKILEKHFPDASAFVDDIAVAGPESDYQNEEVMPGVRRYVLEHIKKLDRVICDLERAEATISGTKSFWGVARMEIVGYEVDLDGRYPAEKKLAKIRQWPQPRNVHEVRQFVGICVFYRQWVFCFSFKAEPLFRLLRKDFEFAWGMEQQQAMDILKDEILSAPSLITIDYKSGRMIFVGVDASAQGGGAVLEQVGEDGKRHPARFESTLWSESESKWHSTKLECKAVLWALKKFALYLYGARFTIETDARVLISQLNRSSTDLPGTVMNRWLSAILLWDFEIVHVAGKKNVIADALSRYPQPDGWTQPQEPEEDLEPFINYMVGKHDDGSVFNIVDSNTRILQDSYTEESEEIARFLHSGKRPDHLSRSGKRHWTRTARTFFERSGHLFKKSTRNLAVRRVVDDPEVQKALIWEVHKQLCHRGVQGTNAAVQCRFWWKGQFKMIQNELRICLECQTKQGARMEEMLRISTQPTMFDRWTIDITYMPSRSGGVSYLAVAREASSGYPEARALKHATANTMAKFIYEDIICRWGAFSELSVDGGPENKSVVEALAKYYGIHRIRASSYNSKAQGMIERGHRPLVVALAKLGGNWVHNLPSVLWADRVTVRRPTGLAPAELVMGKQPVLPIELSLESWQTLPWDAVESTSDLLALRTKQLEWKGEKLAEAIGRTTRSRLAAAEQWDLVKAHDKDLDVGTLVLVWDAVRATDKSVRRKLDDRWLGPYRIASKNANTGTYWLEELDGTSFRHTTHGNRLKRFYQREPNDEAILMRGRLKLFPEDMPIEMVKPVPKPHPAPRGAVEESDSDSEKAGEGYRRETRAQRTRRDMEVPAGRIRRPSPQVIIRKPAVPSIQVEVEDEVEEDESSSEDSEASD